MSNYYIGDIRKDSLNGKNHGWVVGTFMDEGLVQKNDEVEIKYWEFPVGKIDHPTKISSVIEITLILEGSMSGEVDGKRIVLKKGDYIVIKPGTTNNTARYALEKVAGITIKAPSVMNSKKVVG